VFCSCIIFDIVSYVKHMFRGFFGKSLTFHFDVQESFIFQWVAGVFVLLFREKFLHYMPKSPVGGTTLCIMVVPPGWRRGAVKPEQPGHHHHHPPPDGMTGAGYPDKPQRNGHPGEH
jgi:hypothetical protein